MLQKPLLQVFDGLKFLFIVECFHEKGKLLNLENSIIISTSFKELKPADASQHFFAEVVLLDKTPPGAEPSLYQVKKEQLPEEEDILALRHGILTLQNDPFIMMGEVRSLNRKLRQITLANGNVISYRYLIINTGSRHDNEFAAALQTLFHALLLSKKILTTVPNLQQKTHEHVFNANALFPEPIIEKIVQQQLTATDLQSAANLISTISKLSEVQM